jgi:hypothetical protein
MPSQRDAFLIGYNSVNVDLARVNAIYSSNQVDLRDFGDRAIDTLT